MISLTEAKAFNTKLPDLDTKLAAFLNLWICDAICEGLNQAEIGSHILLWGETASPEYITEFVRKHGFQAKIENASIIISGWAE